MNLTVVGFFLYSFFLGSILFSYFRHYPIPGFLYHLSSVLSTGILLVATLFWGQKIFGILKFDLKRFTQNRIWSLLLSFAMGMGFLGTAVLFLGRFLPGDLSLKLKVFSVVFFAFPLFSWPQIRQQLKLSLSFSDLSVKEGILIFVGLIGLLLSFVSCFSPITYYDSLVYHLALPNFYLQQGAIQSVPFNLYSQFPALMEMIFLFVLALFPNPESVINLFQWSMSVAISVGIFQWVQKKQGRPWGFLGFALWWSMPSVLFLSRGAYVDVPLAFFGFVAVWVFLQQINRKQNNTKAWLICGLVAGMACSVKYTGGMTFLLLSALLIGDQYRSPKRLGKNLFFMSTGLLIVFGPWLLKNFLEVKNPVFPFLYTVFGGDISWTTETAAAYFRLLTEYDHKSSLFFQIVTAPWQLISNTLSYGGGFDVLGDFGWPLLISLAPIGLILGWKNKPMRPFILYVVFHFLFWLITKPVLRFLIGLLPLLVIASVLALYFIREKSPAFFKGISLAFVLPFLVAHYFLYFFINQDLQLFSVALGHESRETHLNRRLPYHPIYSQMNKSLTSQDRVLLLGEQRTYHLNVSFIGSNAFAPSQLAFWCNADPVLAKLDQTLRDNNISYILINQGEINRLGGLARFGFNDAGQTVLAGYLNSYAIEALSDGKTTLYKLTS